MEVQARNEVLMVGRLAAVATQRELPSGDWLTTFRLVVDRPAVRSGGPAAPTRTPTVDTFDCVVRTPSLRRRAASWAPGDVLELRGTLHRRFWRAAGRAVSRYEVVVTKARRVGRAI